MFGGATGAVSFQQFQECRSEVSTRVRSGFANHIKKSDAVIWSRISAGAMIEARLVFKNERADLVVDRPFY